MTTRSIASRIVLLILLMLVPLARPSAGQDKEKKTEYTTIEISTHEWSQKAKQYAKLPKVEIFTYQGKASVTPDAETSCWVTDKDGKATLKIASGHPVKLVLLKGRRSVPEVRELAALANTTHQVGIALIPVEEYAAYRKANTTAAAGGAKLLDAMLTLQVSATTKEHKTALKDLDAISQHEQIRPRSGSQTKTSKVAPLTGDVKLAVQKCQKLIRLCRLTAAHAKQAGDGPVIDGAIRMLGGNFDPAYVEPYFANYAALGLLAGVEAGADPRSKQQDLDMVRAWLGWYADKLEDKHGVAPRYGHKLSDGVKRLRDLDNPRNDYDSVDAYAGSYLQAVARYARLGGKPTKKVVDAAERSLRAIEESAQLDGLTYARPDYPVKYLLDNVEAYAGLVEGGRFFRAAGRHAESLRAFLTADRIAASMGGFWDDDHYAMAIVEDGSKQGGVKDGAHVLANLFGLAYLDGDKPELWRTLRKSFAPDGGPAPKAPVEHWLLAARSAAPKEVDALRKQAIKEVASNGFDFRANLPYVTVSRPAVMLLALIDGPARHPAIAFPSAIASRPKEVEGFEVKLQLRVDWGDPEVEDKDVWLVVSPDASPGVLYPQTKPLARPNPAQTRTAFLGQKKALNRPESFTVMLVAVAKGAIKDDKPLGAQDYERLKPLVLDSAAITRNK